MRESKFQSETIKMIRELLPGCVILKNNPNYLQGVPDTLVLFGSRWALIEFKKSDKEPYQPNQEWYINYLNEMSYATMMCPENRKMKLDELQQSLRAGRTPLVHERELVSLAEVRRRKSADGLHKPASRTARHRIA